jgi:Fic family protein
MAKRLDLYTDPVSMEPLFPDDPSGKLEALAIDLIEKAARLSGTLNPITTRAIADFLRPMNSYYSNLIEGHDTHPLDIERALKNDYSKDKAKRDLQKEAYAHINVYKKISEEFKEGKTLPIPSSANYLREIHKRFYDFLPEDFRNVKTKAGKIKEVIPGKFRDIEVEVGRHIAPHFKKLDAFAERFENSYNPTVADNKSKTKRIISIAASHHRLAWIHPFLDGNGRVVRLFSDACFMYENVHASGLWSISRGLARTNKEYKERLANADSGRYGDYDGRGNLSNKFLIEFCEYFLKVAIDQINFMHTVMDSFNMLKRIEGFADLMVVKGKMKPEAKFILVDLFLKGKISKAEAMRITNTSDKTIKLIASSLMEMDLLSAEKESRSMMYSVKYPLSFSPLIFPGLYPSDKEVDMMNTI